MRRGTTGARAMAEEEHDDRELISFSHGCYLRVKRFTSAAVNDTLQIEGAEAFQRFQRCVKPNLEEHRH